ncbi:MAG: hypothetical protein WC346_00370, partial [Methanogenium sp.]
MEFRGINIWTTKMIEEEGLPIPEETLRIGGVFYINPSTTLIQLLKAIDLENEGAYDMAVPEEWARANDYPKAIWFYPENEEGSSRIFGRPMYLS